MMKFAVGFKLQYLEYRLFVVVKEASDTKEESLITSWNITTSPRKQSCYSVRAACYNNVFIPFRQFFK